MKNLKIKFFVCGDSIAAENPKLVKTYNELLQSQLDNVSQPSLLDFESDNVIPRDDTVTLSLLTSISSFPGSFIFNPSYWTLKTFYSTYGKYNDYITWLSCEHEAIWKIKDILSNIESENPNVLCFGFYTWNVDIYINFIKHIKEKYPHIIIIGGGPSVRDDYVLKVLDFAIYGEGEEGFTHLLDALIEDELNFIEIPNLIYKKNNQLITNTYKIFKHKDYPELPSPYLSNKSEIKKSVNEYKNKHKSVLPPSIGWELNRGCPYSCAFCDWSSGLHNKVSIRKHDWKKELDFILELKCIITNNDANWGMLKEDLKVIDYLLEKVRSSVISPFFTFPMQAVAWSKLNKSIVYEAVGKILNEHPTYGVKVAIQDINPEVLKAIARPDVPWEEHKQYLLDLKSKYPFTIFTVELIVGLPKQTLENWIEMLCEFDDSFKPRWLFCAHWQLLPQSPAYKKEYQEKNNMISIKTRIIKDGINLKLDSHNTVDLYKSKTQIWLTSTILYEDKPNGFRDNLMKIATGEIYNSKFFYPEYAEVTYRELYSKLKKGLDRFVDSQYDQMLLNKKDEWMYPNIIYEGTMYSFKSFFHRPGIITKLVENTI